MELNLFDDSLISNPFNEDSQRVDSNPFSIFSTKSHNLNDIFEKEKTHDDKQDILSLGEDNSRFIGAEEKIHISNDDFLKYLDSHFVPEIELDDKPKHSKCLLTEEIVSKIETNFGLGRSTKDSGIDAQTVNLKYKGQKNKYSKGIFAERVDVLYKTLFRSIRRYLWDLFSQEHNPKEIKDKAKASKQFKLKIIEFYQKHFEGTLKAVEDEEEQEKIFIENLASFMSNKFWLPENTFRIRKFRVLITSNLKQYSAQKYCDFFRLEGCVRFFQVLRSSGFIERILEAYPKLSESKRSYLEVIEEIVSIC